MKNSIFSKIENTLALCLLKIGTYHLNLPGEFLYKKGSQKQSIFFLLEGVVSLMNLRIDFKKLLFTGDAFGEEMLFNTQPDKQLLETAKIITQSFVL